MKVAAQRRGMSVNTLVRRAAVAAAKAVLEAPADPLLQAAATQGASRE